MPTASRWMMAFGGVAIVCALIGWNSGEAALRSSVAIGLAMIAAGAAAAQGRSSLRRSGYFIGIFLPVVTIGFCGWRAVDHLRAWSSGGEPIRTALLLTIVTVAALLTTMILLKLRSGDNIAERGYSILPVTPNSANNPPVQRADHK